MSSALPGYEEAAALVAGHAVRLLRSRPAVECVSLGSSAGRVLAEPLCADRDQPPFARSTRDGFACCAAEASAHSPLKLAGATHAGQAPAGPLHNGSVWEIMTGAPVPAGADAVMMLEHVQTAGGKVRLLPPRKLKKGENIVAQGAQAHQGDELLSAGTAIHFAQIALAAACGCASLKVFVRPRVAILATGDELVPIESSPAPGQIRNSNAPMLAAMVVAAGGEPWVLPTVADTEAALDCALAKAAEADLLILSGGVSAGKFDLVEPALARAGARFHFTGVRIQPGKPLVFGELPSRQKAKSPARGKLCASPLFGLPGNPVSSAVTFLLFAAPVLAALTGSSELSPRFALARLSKATDKHSKPGLTRFLPAACTFGTAGQLPEVALVSWQGSGDIAALARSNCFLVIPEETSTLEAGAIVRILLS
jgi:molybdopterin molybdotransferase